jgi:hypothetical protein
VKVYGECREQHDPHRPEQRLARQRRLARGAKPAGVGVHRTGTEVELEVADHVHEHEQHQQLTAIAYFLPT